jgi:phage terminase large subunit-like protein
MTSSARERYREQVYAAYELTCPPRYGTLRDVRRPTYGPKVARIAAKLGTPLMPWQRYVVDTALEIDPATGVFAYRGVGVTVPRQSGKTSIALPVACHRCLAWQRQNVRYAAQNGTAAREKWEDDHLPMLEAAGWIPADGEPLRPRHKARTRKSNGREALIWRGTHSIYGLHSNTEQSGHGKTLHLGLLDELFAQIDDRVYAAWSPAMTTVDSAQSWWFSTAGTAKSVPLNEARDHGREIVASGAPSRTAYFEWSDDPKQDRRDQSLWATYMPALCPTAGACRCSPRWRHTVTLETIAHELEQASTASKLAEFDRAYRNITREDFEAAPDPLVPTLEAWELLADKRSEGAGPVACGIDAYQGYAAIVAIGETVEGLRRQVVLEHGPGHSWVVEKVMRINDELKPLAWAIDDKGESAKLIPQLLAAGLRRMGKEPHRGGLWVPTTSELGGATANWCDRVNGGQLVHLGQAVMAQALAVTRTRPIADGAYAFGRRVSSADITPVVAGSIADAAFERFAGLAVGYDALANIW